MESVSIRSLKQIVRAVLMERCRERQGQQDRRGRQEARGVLPTQQRAS